MLQKLLSREARGWTFVKTTRNKVDDRILLLVFFQWFVVYLIEFNRILHFSFGIFEERVVTSQHDIGEDSQCPYIHLFVILFIKKNLRGHIYSCAKLLGSFSVVVEHTGEAEVSQFADKLWTSIFVHFQINHDILKFEVPVYHALLMQIIEGHQDLLN